ncbi:hypothetical protein RHODOSMS8_01864 [Rhodobiaceae bacterium]|nr:hypothetical protein RHODOSMS8_01864 [Rhodobiaceae bacterium]
MDYEVTLIDADIEGPMKGEMRLALTKNGEEQARVEYGWTEADFKARFVGHAASLSVPAHPTVFMSAPIMAIQELTAAPGDLPTDVFKNHKVFIDVA